MGGGKDVTYASPGAGTPHHLVAEAIARASGIAFVHIPYKGTGPALTDLVSGRVDMLFAMPAGVQPMVSAGKLKILAAASPERFPLLPTTPTVGETFAGVGIPTVDMGLAAPAGTPATIVARLNDEMMRVLALPEIRQTLLDNGMISMAGTPEAYRQRMTAARTEREPMIGAAGVKAD